MVGLIQHACDDIFPASTGATLDLLAAALQQLGAWTAGAPDTGAPGATELARGGTHTLEADAGGLDLHFEPPGAQAWEEVRSRALVLEVAGTKVPVAGLDDLIAMKRASGRRSTAGT